MNAYDERGPANINRDVVDQIMLIGAGISSALAICGCSGGIGCCKIF